MSLAMLEVQVPELLARAYKRAPRGLEESLGEDRVVLGSVSWEQYMAIDEERGADHSHPRLYYLNEQLEIMTTSLQHERLKERLGMLLIEYINEKELDVFPHGQATMLKIEQAGAEPDASWCFGEEKEFPDVVLEIALTSGGLDKLEIYRRFAVREVWFWRKDTLEIWNLRADGRGYDGPGRASQLLPALDLALLERCLALSTWREARRAFRAGILLPDSAR
jgi:Uma2 family endonuclease